MSQFQNRDQITAQTSTGSQRETHVERFISESSQSENYLVNYVRKIEFIHSSSTVYRFNPVTHLLTRSDFHRSILLVHQITEVSQEIIQKLAISSYKYETCFDWDWVQVFSLLCFLLWTLWFSVFLSPSITSPLSPLLSFTLRGSPQGEQNTCQSSSYRRLLEKKARELDETLSHALFLSFFSWKSSLSNSPAAFSLGWPVWFE